MRHLRKFIPILIIITVMILFYALGVNELISWEVFKAHRESIKEFIAEHSIYSALIFMVIYAVLVALSVPIGFLLSMIGGFLFPQPLSILYVLIGATTGASILFLSAKTALKDFFQKKVSKFFASMKEGFRKNSVTYLLLLRVLPLFPFWLVNIAPAFFNISLRTYIWTTFVGIIPGVFVFTQAGRGIDMIFEGEGKIAFWDLLNTEMIIAMIGMIILAFIPMIVNNRKKK